MMGKCKGGQKELYTFLQRGVDRDLREENLIPFPCIYSGSFCRQSAVSFRSYCFLWQNRWCSPVLLTKSGTLPVYFFSRFC